MSDDQPYASQSYGGGIASYDTGDATISIADERLLGVAARGGLPSPNQLDTRASLDLHARLFGHYRRELDIQAAWRKEMAIDEDFYDHDQWSQEDAAELRARGQEPLVFNIIKTSMDWVIGTERRSRVDFKVLARNKNGTAAAEKKSQLMKYLGDVNRAEFAMSDAFDEAATAGLSWLECGLSGEDGEEPIYERQESWRNIVFDSMASERDLRDARYIFRHRWADTDIALASFPDRKGVIRTAAASNTLDLGPGLDGLGDDEMDAREELEAWPQQIDSLSVDSARPRVRLIEAWFRTPVQAERMSGGSFHGEIYDPDSMGHLEDIMSGRAVTTRGITYRIFVAVMTSTGLLSLEPSPYRHNRYPFTPVWGSRRKRDGAPYGIVRGMRDAQRDINRRHSKALAILSSNKVIMDKGAVDDIDELEEEISRPNAIIVKNPNKQLTIDADRDLAGAHIEMMRMSMGMVQSLSGVTDENLGRKTNATSGRAIVARQEQGALATVHVFDNLRFARQVHGEKLLALCEQFMSEEKEFRITNKRGSPSFVTINDGSPDNDIVRAKADFIISESDWNATIRQSMVEELMALMQQLAPAAPQIVLVVLDLLVEAMDVPARDEIVKRIRQITGMEDPDADPNAPDPQREAREQMQAMQTEMQMRMANAQLAGAEAKAAETAARADKLRAEGIRTVGAVATDEMEKQRLAIEAAALLLQNIGLVDVADQLLATADQRAMTMMAPPEPVPGPEPQSSSPDAGASPPDAAMMVPAA